jgi:Zn-dependent protease with chaperone function
MNFFEHQDQARRNTTRLVVLFLFAVTFVVISTALVISGVVTYFQTQNIISTEYRSVSDWAGLFSTPVFAWSALGTLVIIALGSTYKNLQLGGNGIQVALSMNAKHIHPETKSPVHKRLLNIVTEMALASGNPVPKVFVIPGDGINAFAAGYHRHQIVVSVTEGALAQLSRDELQGVIAHEFSHINFGDVKINMRLVALLHGILLIGLIGQHLIGTRYHGGGIDSSRSKNRGAGLGIALVMIGYTGTFFGNIIKAAVSRQREFLADASAVQFTRNPDGIASALKKIASGSKEQGIASENAEQYSHFYFSSLRPHFLGGLFNTHPAIEERITRLGHSLDKSSGAKDSPSSSQNSQNAMGFANSEENTQGFKESAASTGSSEQIMASVGEPTIKNIAAAKSHLTALPAELVKATQNAFDARILIYGLIIENTPKSFQAQQIEYLKKQTDLATITTLTPIRESIRQLQAKDYHTLILMSQAAILDQSPEQAIGFQHCARALIEADKQLTLFEWCIYRLAIAPYKVHLDGNKKLSDCQPELGVLFYYTLTQNPPNSRAVILQDVHRILGVATIPLRKVSLSQLDSALSTLAQLKPLSKPILLKALIACIRGDDDITADEFALLRMVALVLDCPIPDIE